MITVSNKKLVQDYWEAISGKEKTPELSDIYVSDPELKGHIAFFESVFPKYELFADDFICEDDKVVVRARFKGIHQGKQLGIPPTGKTVELPFAIIYQIKEGKISKNWMFFDQMELMTLLGVNAEDN